MSNKFEKVMGIISICVLCGLIGYIVSSCINPSPYTVKQWSITSKVVGFENSDNHRYVLLECNKTYEIPLTSDITIGDTYLFNLESYYTGKASLLSFRDTKLVGYKLISE